MEGGQPASNNLCLAPPRSLPFQNTRDHQEHQRDQESRICVHMHLCVGGVCLTVGCLPINLYTTCIPYGGQKKRVSDPL